MTPVGRFAPSPTGRLHMGSLYAALASYLSVKSRDGRWLIRIDDLDEDRNVAGADKDIIDSLAAHGLYPDEPVIYQNSRIQAYADALARLTNAGRLFSCRCSRKDLQGLLIYPGTCRSIPAEGSTSTLRFRVADHYVCFEDRVQGSQQFQLDKEIGDFVVRRRDRRIAYSLACAVDDGNGDITEVVRGADLLSATLAQISLMEALDLRVPAYGHIPVLKNAQGQKLSKQTFAKPVDTGNASRNIVLCLTMLGISPPEESILWPVERLIEFARRNFDIQRIPTELPAGIAE